MCVAKCDVAFADVVVWSYYRSYSVEYQHFFFFGG